MPKPPPTSGVSTRTFSAGTLRMSASGPVNSQPPWVQLCSVTCPLAASNSPIAARGSIGLATRRLLMIRTLVTWAAPASAVSTASGSPCCQSKARLAGTSSCTRGLPGSAAVSVSTTAGSDLYSTATSSAASLAWVRVSATTNATWSPTWRTRSTQSTGRSGLMPSEPSRLTIGTAQGSVLVPSASISAPVITASTPGARFASEVSMLTILAWASGERTA